MFMGIIFTLSEFFNLGKLKFFAAGISSFAMVALCYFFPDIFQPFSSIEKMADLMLRPAGHLVPFFIVFFFTTNLLVPQIIRYVYGEKFHGSEAFAGKRGKALTHLRKNDYTKGKVLLDDTEWDAVPDYNSPDIQAGSTVEIVGMKDWILWVKPERR